MRSPLEHTLHLFLESCHQVMHFHFTGVLETYGIVPVTFEHVLRMHCSGQGLDVFGARGVVAVVFIVNRLMADETKSLKSCYRDCRSKVCRVTLLLF